MNELPPASHPTPESPVYWGDRLALQIWLAGSVVLWLLALTNLIAGLWPR